MKTAEGLISEALDYERQYKALYGDELYSLNGAEHLFACYDIKEMMIRYLMGNTKRTFFPELTDSQFRSLNGRMSCLNAAKKRNKLMVDFVADIKSRYDERLERTKKWKKREAELDTIVCHPEFFSEYNYERYLQTKHWTMVSDAVKQRDGMRCKLCNSEEHLNAHHRNYKYMWLPEKEAKDLITLCQPCHELFHKHRKIT